MPREFRCTAEILLDLLETFHHFRWKEKIVRKRISYLLGGHYPIYLGGQKLTEDIKYEEKGDEQKFLELIDDIYGGVNPEIATCKSFSERWRDAAKIITLGKNKGIPAEDWREAIRKKA